MAPTLIHSTWIILAFSPCLPLTSVPNSQKSASCHLPFVYLMVPFQCTCVGGAEILSRTPVGNNFIN